MASYTITAQDIEHFRSKIKTAEASGDQQAADKLTKQLEILEDAIIVYGSSEKRIRRYLGLEEKD